LDSIAQALLDKETLDRSELERLVAAAPVAEDVGPASRKRIPPVALAAE